MTAYVAALFCVLGLAMGQLLFKVSANALATTGSLLSPKPAITLLAALSLYGITSIAWVWILQKIELGRIYPIMALAFVLVPLGSHFFFNEKFSLSYFYGVALIMLGIIIVARS